MGLGVYIHIPFCRSKCGYCSFNSTSDLTLIHRYCDALEAETASRADKSIEADTVYIGGGTPSVLPFGALSRILDCVRRSFRVTADCEITVEANPESCTAEFAGECGAAGVNRVSMGLQSTDDKLLKILNRPHRYGDFLSALDRLSDAGITNVSADLMAGLPTQSRADFRSSLEKVVRLPLKHISVYALSVEEGTRFYDNGVTTDDDLQALMYDDCVRALKDCGFERYEVSNFAVSGFESRHNSKYWNLSPYIGLGLSAHSYLNKTRIENTDRLIDYLCGRTEKQRGAISDSETAEEYLMLSLRTRDGIDCGYLKDVLGCDILTKKQKEIQNLINLNALTLKNGRLQVTEQSFYVLSSIITALI